MLKKSQLVKDSMIAKLSDMTFFELTKELTRILKPYLRNRTVTFSDSMGSCTCDISHRRGGAYIVNSCEVYYSPKGSVYGCTFVSLETCAWLKEVMDLIDSYNDISNTLFAVDEIVIKF